MELTKNFTLAEYTRTSHLNELSKAGRVHQQNPTDKELKCIMQHAKMLQQVRDAFGKPIIISSGFRIDELNNLLPDSVPGSEHTFGCATDNKTVGEFTVTEMIRFAKIAVNVGFKRIGLGKTYIHLGIGGEVYPGKWPSPAVWGYANTNSLLYMKKAEFLKMIHDLSTKH